MKIFERIVTVFRKYWYSWLLMGGIVLFYLAGYLPIAGSILAIKTVIWLLAIGSFALGMVFLVRDLKDGMRTGGIMIGVAITLFSLTRMGISVFSLSSSPNAIYPGGMLMGVMGVISMIAVLVFIAGLAVLAVSSKNKLIFGGCIAFGIVLIQIYFFNNLFSNILHTHGGMTAYYILKVLFSLIAITGWLLITAGCCEETENKIPEQSS